MIRAGIQCHASPKRCRLLEKYREGKNAFSLVGGERLENASYGGKPVKLDLGREWEFGQFELGRMQRSGNSLNKVVEEAGRHHRASGFPTPTGLGSRLYENSTETRKEGSSPSDNTGGLAHR